MLVESDSNFKCYTQYGKFVEYSKVFTIFVVVGIMNNPNNSQIMWNF
jgi:hypothetical protein